MESLIKERISNLTEAAVKHYGIAVSPIKSSVKLRNSNAGECHFDTRTVHFNLTLAALDPIKFLQEVVAHEVSHLLVLDLYGAVDFIHGRQWQSVMKVLGAAPRIVHRYLEQTFLWKCDCTVHELTKRNHNRFSKNPDEFECSVCKSSVIYIPS